MAELFELEQQIMSFRSRPLRPSGTPLVGELHTLVHHHHPFDFGSGDEEELFVGVSSEFLEAVVQKP